MIKDLEKLEFVNLLFERFSKNTNVEYTKQEITRFLLSHTQNGKLFKYRACNEYAFSNLTEGTLYCASPSSFNDPFDCQVGIDLNSYISAKYGQEISLIDNYFDKFLRLYDGAISLASCSDNEKYVFNKWLNSNNLICFLDNYRGNDINEVKLGEIILNNFNIVIELLIGFIADSDFKNQMVTSLNIMPGLIKMMSPDGIMEIADENATYADFARNMGINEDADEITLAKLMYQLYRPEDALTAVKMDEDLERLNKEMGQTVDGMFRVGCLCTDYKNRLMWSHYADGHKGFCIEYDFSCNTDILNDLLILPVIYSKERPKFPWKVALAFDKDSNSVKCEGAQTMIQSLLIKDEAWSYEDEWRIITLCSSGIVNIKMPPVSCIYIGALCSDDNKIALTKIANKLNVPLKQMIVDRGEYALHAQII